jgi:hypothetical protein
MNFKFLDRSCHGEILLLIQIEISARFEELSTIAADDYGDL